MNLKKESRAKIRLQYLKMEKSNLRTQMKQQILLKVMRLRLAIIKRVKQLIQMPRKVKPNLRYKLVKASMRKMVVYQWFTSLLGLRLSLQLLQSLLLG